MSAALVTADLDDAVGSAAASLTPLSRLQPETEWLRADVGRVTPPLRIDRANGVIYGRVLAEKGPFKSRGRGEFDDKSLDLIVELANQHAGGLKSRFTHPSLSADGLGKFLGRDKNVRRDGDRVRGDLHLDKTALQTPPSGGKPLGLYVMDLAESDPAAFGSSLVLKADEEHRLNEDGTPKKDDKGDRLPPLWRPKRLHAIDVVDEGDAVHNGFLGVDDLPDVAVRQVAAALDAQFSGCDRPTVESRGRQFLTRYLDLRFGDADMGATDTKPEAKAGVKPDIQPAGLSPEMTAWLAEQRAALEAQAATIKADLEAQREAARLRAKAEDEMACLKQAQALCEKGAVTAAALDDSDAAAVPLGSFLHLLDNAAPVRTAKDAKGKDVTVTLRGAFLALLPTLRPQRGGERLSGPPAITDARTAQKAAIKDTLQRNRQPAGAK